MVPCVNGYTRIYHRGMATPTVQRLSSRLKLRHFALLTELDRHRSISRTALQLNLAQPTVTRALAEIEQIFMAPLFVRGRRGLEPTPAGELVLARARHALADAESLERDLAALDAGFRGTLRMGVIPYLSNNTHDAIWRHLLALRPAPSYVVEEATTDRLLDAVKNRRLDCAICRFTSADIGSGLVQRHLYHQEPRLVVSGAAARRLARRGLDWEAFASLPWILPPVQTPIRDMIQAIFASAGQQLPAPVLEAYAQKTLASLLRQLPNAITILPDDIATEVALASGARVLPQRLQWNLPPVGMVRREDVGSADLIDGIAASIRRGSPAGA
jgi:DNA-binding transcriptional LysR family regulator